MIIKGKTAFVYDVEVFPNFFSCAIKNTESGNIKVYEISDRQNDLWNIIKVFLNRNIIWVSFNGIHYDNPIISFLIIHRNELNELPSWGVCARIKQLSDTIISTVDNNFSSWSKYKYANLFDVLDLLTMMFSSKLRVGLKELQVTMQYKTVQEYDGDFNSYLPEKDFDKLQQYNINDINSTEELLNRLQKDINLRIGIEEEYGVNVLSKDGVSIGKEILKTKYLQDTGKTWNDIKDLRSPCDYVPLKDVIIPEISYETEVLQNLLKEMKTLTVSPGIKGWNKTFPFFETMISIGVGGLHSINKPEIIVPDEDECLMDWDAASLYPTLLIEWGFYPQHLGKEFLNTYSNIKKERIEAKHNGNKVKNETLKLTLNSVTGLMQNEYSWLYSPKDVMKIRINGQLFLLKLAEMLILGTGCRVIQYNTDGIFVLIKKDQLDKASTIIKQFEQLSRLTMEGEEFESFYQYAINDYIAVHKGYSETKDPNLIKTKGLFINKVSLGKGMAPQIIAEALIRYFVDGISIEDTIKNCVDIRKFLTYQKVDKKFGVEYNGELITHVNRYYMSTNGYYLFKCLVDSSGKRSNYINMCSTSGVTLFNVLSDINPKDAHINYNWYINEVNKIVLPLEESLQPTLF